MGPRIRELASTALYPLCGALLLTLLFRVAGSAGALSTRGNLTLLGASVLLELVVAAAVVLALALRALARRLRDTRLTRGPLIPALVLGLAVIAPLLWVGRALASGPWISQQSWVDLVRVGPAAAGALATMIGAALFLALPAAGAGRRRGRGLLTALALVAGAAAAIADARVAVGLYPEFHLTAIVIAAIFALVAAQRLLTFHPQIAAGVRRLGWLAIPALGLTAATWLQMPRIVRAELLLRSSVAATLIRTTSTLPPRTYLHEALSRLDLGDEAEAEALPRGLITVGDDWNVILITVDTLRADTLPPARDGDEDFAQEGDTPVLDQWIAGSYRFRRAYASATMTHRSMPALFRSLETYEDPLRFGIPISTYMASHGRTPVAIANNYFIEPRFASARALLDGFERISIYEKQEMRDQVALTRELIESVDGRPFFAWVHFYCMHDPGYDGKMLSSKDGNWPKRYRASLRWLDAQMGALLGAIDELGIGEKTLIVFTSDHGEGLGEHGTLNHGPTVFDPEIRIPLVIHIPGREGAEIDATVGNIDVLPTIVDLLGLPLDPAHRGQSLVPLLADPEATTWDRDYYIENDKGKVVGLVQGETKLVYDIDGDSLYRFDLANDPEEVSNLYMGDEEADRDLLARLLVRNPSLFRDELENEATRGLLRERLAAVDPRDPPDFLPFLVRLLALAPAEIGLAEALTIFDEADDDATRLLLLLHLFDADPAAWEKRLADHIRALADTPAELEFVTGLALQGQPVFDRGLAASRVDRWSRSRSPSEWLPWLRLIERWPQRSVKGYGKALVRMLRRADGDPEIDAQTLEQVLRTVATLGQGAPLPEPADRTSAGERDLVKAVVPFLEHPEPVVQVAACDALATVDNGDSTTEMRALLGREGTAIEVKQAALRAVVALEGTKAIALVMRQGNDPLLTVDAIDHLRRLGSPRGLSFLRKIRRDHYNPLIRKRATSAIKAIEEAEKQRKEAEAAARAEATAESDGEAAAPGDGKPIAPIAPLPAGKPIDTATPPSTALPDSTAFPDSTATPPPTALPDSTATPPPTALPDSTATPPPTRLPTPE